MISWDVRVWLVGFLVIVAAGSAHGDDFKVENKVFLEKQKEPAARSTTIFRGGVVYDFLEEPAEVTVFHPTRGRFVLLDTVGQLKTELSTDFVKRAMERIKQRAGAGTDPLMKFLADPKLEEGMDEPTGELTFESPLVKYHVLGVDPESPVIVHQYREFSDWYKQLNTALNPGSPPPFARLIVNAALEKRGEIPREVRLTLVSMGGVMARRTMIRSEHRLVRRLVESDRRRIERAAGFITTFRKVGLAEYQATIKTKEGKIGGE
jgi:hypothetical protein